jgi:hypothetical protein
MSRVESWSFLATRKQLASVHIFFTIRSPESAALLEWECSRTGLTQSIESSLRITGSRTNHVSASVTCLSIHIMGVDKHFCCVSNSAYRLTGLTSFPGQPKFPQESGAGEVRKCPFWDSGRTLSRRRFVVPIPGVLQRDLFCGGRRPLIRFLQQFGRRDDRDSQRRRPVRRPLLVGDCVLFPAVVTSRQVPLSAEGAQVAGNGHNFR